MDNQLHLIKLSVGTESVDTLQDWQASPRAQGPDGLPRHVTRMWPKREKELLDGGSIYWVIKGFVQARQRILMVKPPLDRLTVQLERRIIKRIRDIAARQADQANA